MKRLVFAAGIAAAMLAGCGGDMNGDDDSAVVVDAPSSADGSLSDAGGCFTNVSFTPSFPVAPATVVARADVFGASGIITYDWHLNKDGNAVPFTPLDTDSRDIRFEALSPGIYQISLEVGAGCSPFFNTLNVAAMGANNRAVRLRFVPPTSVLAPPQERTIVVSGGSDYAAGLITLDPGTIFPIAVRGPGSTPAPGYLRFTSRSTPDAVVEGFSDVSGAAGVRLVAGRYDVLVVPTSAALAPAVISNWDPITGALNIDAGLALGGSVLDAAGAPVAGARVSVMSAGIPSTIGTTAADGSFSLRWRDGGAAEAITVVAPPGSDLPRLDASVELGALTSIIVRHAAAPSSDVGGTLVRVGGAAAVSAEVLVALSRPSSGTVRDGTTVLAQATGSHRRTLVTDATGHLPAARFVDGTGAAFIATPGAGATAALTLPLAGNLDAAAPVIVTGHVRRSGGTDRALARVRATLTGTLAYAGSPVPTAIAGLDGRFSITLAAGGAYTLTITDPTADDAALTPTVGSAANADLGDLTLPPALAVTGEVRATGQSVGARAVGVAALCHLDCTGVARSRPLGEAVSDPAGRFVVAVPDPGVSQ